MKRKLSKIDKSLVKRLEHLAYNINMTTVDTFIQHYHRRCMLKKLENYLKEKAKAEDIVQYEINELQAQFDKVKNEILNKLKQLKFMLTNSNMFWKLSLGMTGKVN